MEILEILTRASKLHVCVLGDAMLDRYIDGDVSRISPEAPVMVVRVRSQRENPGGAGNVVSNLRSLGCHVDFYFDPDNPIIKTRIMSGNHHLIRLDEEFHPKWMLFDNIGSDLRYKLLAGAYDVVVLSDYSKGFVSQDVATDVIQICRLIGVPVVVDSKHNLEFFEDATLVKCNASEWAEWVKKVLWSAGQHEYVDNWKVGTLVITEGDKGLQYWDKNMHRGMIAGIPIDMSDPCGAGDTVTAMLAISVALGLHMMKACELANVAASEVCRHPGVVSITREALMRRFNEVKI